jgi:hypothetical protein
LESFSPNTSSNGTDIQLQNCLQCGIGQSIVKVETVPIIVVACDKSNGPDGVGHEKLALPF